MQNIGPNKVTLNIRDSPFYERTANPVQMKQCDPPIDLLDMYRKGVKPKCSNEYSQPNVNNREPIKTNNKVKERSADELLFNLMKLVDPLISLYKSASDIDDKVLKFKEDLIKNLTNFHGMYKKLLLHKRYKLEEVIDAINDVSLDLDKRKSLLLYIARLVDVSIMIVFTDDRLPYLIKCGQKCRMLIFNVEEHNIVLDMEEYDTSSKERDLMCKKVEKYRKEGILQKVSSYTVKELREVAEDLDISLHNEDDGQRKLCLKPELKERIVKKIETHNT
jgi:hypothetical protein